MKVLFRVAGGILTMMVLASSQADNLIDIYQQALLNDPTFKKAQADWLTAKQNFPLALTGNGSAGSGLFPNISLNGSAAKDYQRTSSRFGHSSGKFDANNVTINFTQPVFNLQTWLSISSARYSVKAATALYLASAQNLMARVEKAYFEVLRANDTLNLTLAQQNQFKYQLDTAEQKFKVGLIAITGVYDAQASYDRSIADEIRDRNNLLDRIEDLRAITGRHYDILANLNSVIPLLTPKPCDIDGWVEVSLRQNYVIQSDLNNMLTARENVKVAAVGNMPTINFTASYSDGTEGGLTTIPAPTVLPHTRTQQTLVGGNLNFPIVQGGFVIANTRQASYQYLSASDQLQLDYRTVENSTRQAYLGIESGISQIQADQQAILSARNQLEATKAGYIVGTRTMVDVLDSVTSLTQTQLAYANDRYDYVEGIFNLKFQAGTLAPEDVEHMNSWLGKEVRFSLKQPKVKPRKVYGKGMPAVNADLLELNKPELTNPIGSAAVKAAEPRSSMDGTKLHNDFSTRGVREEDQMMAPYVSSHPPQVPSNSGAVILPPNNQSGTDFQSLPKPSEQKTKKKTGPGMKELLGLENKKKSLSAPAESKKVKPLTPSQLYGVPSLTTDSDLTRKGGHPDTDNVEPSMTTDPYLGKGQSNPVNQDVKPSMNVAPLYKKPTTDVQQPPAAKPNTDMNSVPSAKKPAINKQPTPESELNSDLEFGLPMPQTETKQSKAPNN